MSTDYGEKEREFIASLGDDTGRDLNGWMAAISASTMTSRNDIIDWLRHQGFPFSKASWLERIHHNGGKLIYADANPARAYTTAGSTASGSAAIHAIDIAAPLEIARVQATKPAPIVPEPVSWTLSPEVASALAAAKGLRPLCELVLREIENTLPGTAFTTNGQLVMVAAPQPFAALLPAPKKLRIYANFGSAGAGIVKAADLINKMPAPFPHMLVLDDARRVDEAFQALMRAAAQTNAGADGT